MDILHFKFETFLCTCLLIVLFAILRIFIDFSGAVLVWAELFIEASVVTDNAALGGELSLEKAANKFTVKAETVKTILQKIIFIFYSFAVFTTVFFKITGCITFTTLVFAVLVVLTAKSGITMFANVFFRITICITCFIFKFLPEITKHSLAAATLPFRNISK